MILRDVTLDFLFHVLVYGSCKEILGDKPGSADGVYQLRSGKHYCVMRHVQGCGAGGWTLVMKVNGSKVRKG